MFPRFSSQRQQRGFTLIEILAVIVIIGILAAAIVPNILGRTDDARITKTRHDIRTLEGALKVYRLDNYYYPSTEQGLDALVQQPSGEPPAKNWKQGGYIDRLSKDPWGNSYQYLNPGTHGEIDIFSLGADNRPGGEGPEADIGNWNLDG